MTYLSISLVFAALLVLAIGRRLLERRENPSESDFRVDDDANAVRSQEVRRISAR